MDVLGLVLFRWMWKWEARHDVMFFRLESLHFVCFICRCHRTVAGGGWSDISPCMPCITYFLQAQPCKGELWISHLSRWSMNIVLEYRLNFHVPHVACDSWITQVQIIPYHNSRVQRWNYILEVQCRQVMNLQLICPPKSLWHLWIGLDLLVVTISGS